jgi:hypothetical protein
MLKRNEPWRLPGRIWTKIIRIRRCPLGVEVVAGI